MRQFVGLTRTLEEMIALYLILWEYKKYSRKEKAIRQKNKSKGSWVLEQLLVFGASENLL